RRRTAHHHACTVIQSRPQVTRFLEVEQWLVDLPRETESVADLQRKIPKAAAKMLAQQFRRVRKRARKFAGLDATQRHRLRIACKTMRYNAELLGQLFSRHDVKVFIKRLKALQDDLGALNDVRTAHHLLGQLQRKRPVLASATGEVLGWRDRE